MGCGYEFVSNVLLCSEDNNSILVFDDEEEGGGGILDVFVDHPDVGNHQSSDFYGEFFMGFPLQSDECLGLLVLRESDHMPKDDYTMRLQTGALDLSVRKEAIDWIWKVHAHYSFGPLSAYLSVNYLDRFLSYYELPKGKAWMTQLLSVACLSLAAKMEETEVPLPIDLQVVDSKYVFEARTIQRMELLVLNILKWRMQAVAPFSFIDYFLHKFNDGKPPRRSSLSQSVELILNMITRIDFLEFRPSEIAAAVALSVSGENDIVDAEKALFSCIHVNKERVLRCCEVISDMELLNGDSLSPVPQSPIGVLDAACLSFKSDDTAVGSQANSHQTSPEAKRRKIDRLSVS